MQAGHGSLLIGSPASVTTVVLSCCATCHFQLLKWQGEGPAGKIIKHPHDDLAWLQLSAHCWA